MKKWSKFFFDFAALVLGLILPLAFAPYQIFPIAILSPALLMLLCLDASPKRAFTRGYLFGLGYFGMGVYWVFISIHVFGDVVVPIAVAITAGLVAALALFPALTTFFTARLQTNNRIQLVFSFPAFWVLLEWVRSWLCSGFPWLLIGSSQTNSPLKGYAAIGGVYSVSLATILTGTIIVYGVLLLIQKNYWRAYLQFFTVLMIWIVASAVNHIDWTTPIGKQIPVSLVQGNIPQSIKWDPSHLQQSVDTYEALTEPLLKKSGQIIIWPEAAIPILLNDIQDYINGLDESMRSHNVTLILGIPIQRAETKEYLNTIVSIGTERHVYAKRHLVPFGEYTPFSKVLSGLLSFMDIPMSNLSPGNPVQEPFIINNVTILANICYEIAFPELIRVTDPNVGFVLTLTNDAWFGKSAASAQHLQMAQMRALELGRYVLMVGNDGITAIVGPKGEIKDVAPQRQAYVLEGSVQPMYGSTPWMTYGMDPILIFTLSMLFIAIRSSFKTRFLATKNTVALQPKVLNDRASEDQTT